MSSPIIVGVKFDKLIIVAMALATDVATVVVGVHALAMTWNWFVATTLSVPTIDWSGALGLLMTFVTVRLIVSPVSGNDIGDHLDWERWLQTSLVKLVVITLWLLACWAGSP